MASSYSTMTRNQLLSLCKEHKLKRFSTKKKEDLIQLLLNTTTTTTTTITTTTPTKIPKKIKKPILIIQGTKDLQVSTINAQNLKKANPKAKPPGNPGRAGP